MIHSVSPDAVDTNATLLDVRKPRARTASGQTIPESQWHHPFDAANWAAEYAGRKVVVFCVHGHEVSQAVCGYLRDEGAEAVFLEGGFEAWRDGGHNVATLDGADD